MGHGVERVDLASLAASGAGLDARAAPLVVTDSVGERVRASWSPQSLLAAVGAQSVTLLTSDHEKFDQLSDGEPNYAAERVTFAEALRRIAATEPPRACYARHVPLADLGLDETEYPAHALLPAAASRIERNLWIGSAGCVSGLHYDGKNNLLTQLHGRKRVTLIPASEHARVEPFGLGFRDVHASRVDLETLDRAAHPQFPLDAAVAFDLLPGETLYIPALWWHHVRSLDACVSVNVWWAARPEQLLVANSVDYLRLKYKRDALAALYEHDPDRAARLLQLARASLGENLPCAAALFAGASARAALDALSRAHDPLGETAGSVPRGDAESLAASLVADGVLSREEARLVRLALFVAEVAASQGEARGVADLERLTGEVARFVAARVGAERVSGA
ncbi:MAG: cupin-like domain-containing protein [Pyrinomonadaceae bacterium]